MAFTLDNAVSIYYSALGHQNDYWNIYIAVSFGLLAYFGTAKVRLDTTKLIIIGFIVFALSNLYNICSIQNNLVEISTGITQYIDIADNSSKIPTQFKQSLLNIKAISAWLVGIYHMLSIVLFSYVMFKLWETNKPGN